MNIMFKSGFIVRCGRAAGRLVCLAGCPEDKPRRGVERVFQREMHLAACFTIHPPLPEALHHEYVCVRAECTVMQGVEHSFQRSTQGGGRGL